MKYIGDINGLPVIFLEDYRTFFISLICREAAPGVGASQLAVGSQLRLLFELFRVTERVGTKKGPDGDAAARQCMARLRRTFCCLLISVGYKDN